MSLKELVKTAQNKHNFEKLDGYIDFARRFLDFIGDARNRQAEIVSQNETHYRFWQYGENGNFNVTRPINSNLMIPASQSQVLSKKFPEDAESGLEAVTKRRRRQNADLQVHLHDSAVHRSHT